MTEKKPSQNTMDKIMRGNVKQVPRWHFVLKNIILWFVGAVCIIAGALTVSLVIFTFANSAFTLRDIASNNFWQHVMIVLPFLWIVATILFAGLFRIFVRHTKRGYKYSLSVILVVNIVLSIIVGVVFYFFGISHVVDDILGGHFQYYRSVEKRQAKLFDNPEKGVIIGQATGCEQDHFIMVTSGGKQWYVINKYIPQFKKEVISDGQRFVVIGKKVDDDTFVACDIRMRGVFGGNAQVRYKNMNQIQKTGNNGMRLRARNDEQMSAHIEEMVESACQHVQSDTAGSLHE